MTHVQRAESPESATWVGGDFVDKLTLYLDHTFTQILADLYYI